MKPTPEALTRSIATTTANAKRLFEDAKQLFDYDRFPSAFALAILAQEEFAKAWLLQLVEDDAIPWISAVRRSMSRHECKHLLGIVLEWLPIFEEAYGREDRWGAYHTAWMAWHERRMDRRKSGRADDHGDPEPSKPDVPFPPEVASALNIYRHEQIQRLRSSAPWTDDDWAQGTARKVADGSVDRKKQSALYVHIGKTGEVGLHPELITQDEAAAALALAERFSEGAWYSDEYRKLREALPLLFDDLLDDD